MDTVIAALEWLEVPHGLIIAGTLLVIAALVGLLMNRRREIKVGEDLTTLLRPQVPPLPEILDSRRRKSRQSKKTAPSGQPVVPAKDFEDK